MKLSHELKMLFKTKTVKDAFWQAHCRLENRKWKNGWVYTGRVADNARFTRYSALKPESGFKFEEKYLNILNALDCVSGNID